LAEANYEFLANDLATKEFVRTELQRENALLENHLLLETKCGSKQRTIPRSLENPKNGVYYLFVIVRLFHVQPCGFSRALTIEQI